jgi:hypothetical protein
MSQPITSSSNTKYLSIIPENGETFDPGQKLIFNLEPNLGYIKKDSYMIFDVLNRSTNAAMVGFPQQVGAHALIENVRIYSKHTGVLLESLENYSQLQALVNQYGFDDKTQLQMKQGVGSPCVARNNSVSTNGQNLASGYQHTSAAEIANCQLSPISVGATGVNPTASFLSRRFCVPLRAGLFRFFDSEKLIPILNFGGLRIEINLNPANLALQRLSAAQSSATDHKGYVDVDLINAGILCDAKAAAGTALTLTSTSNRVLQMGLCVGNSIRVYNPAGGGQAETDTTTTIASFAVAANKVVITTAANIPALDATARLFTSVGPANATNTVGIDAMNYRITNAEFRIAQVVPSPEQAKDLMKELKYEFTSYDVFLDNIDGGTLRHQVPINSVSSKALGILSLLYQSDYERNQSTASYYSCETPLDAGNRINSIQYFINNKLYPLRDYNPLHIRDRVLTLNENVKTLKAIGIAPKMLGLNQGGYAEDYNNTFFVSRELARNGFVFDLRNAEAELRLGFSGVRAQRLRVNTFVFSKKIVQTTATGVEVVL